jgi:AraC-like DNA-binding protein
MKIFHQPHNSQSNYNYNIFIYDNVNYTHHFHKNYEIAYVLSGKALYSVNGRLQTLNEGDFALCLSNEIHSVKSLENSRVWIGVFSEDFVHEFKKRIDGKAGVDFKFRCSESANSFLLDNLINNKTDDILLLKACLYTLTSEFLRQVELTARNDRRGSLMAEIAAYIAESYKKNISLKTLSAHLGYDYCYLSKAFNDMFSMSFTDYLNTFRIDHALALLTNSNLSVTDIAFESGFQSIRSFNNVFKNRMGLSPAEFRKKDGKCK